MPRGRSASARDATSVTELRPTKPFSSDIASGRSALRDIPTRRLPSSEDRMITLTRRQARRLRGVFRRAALGIAHRGPVPPIVLAVEGDRVLATYRHGSLAVEHAELCQHPSSGSVTLPLDALADIEGKDDAIVALEAAAPDRTFARWTDRGIPQAKEYAVPAIESPNRFPGPAGSWSEAPPDLLDALAGAAETAAEDDSRYALSCILLKAGHNGHEVVATDGRQMLIRGTSRLPWDGDVVIRRSPIFACKGLPRDRPWSVARADQHVLLRSGPWTIALEIQADARFPRVDQVFPAADAATARLRLDPADAQFLADALGRLPGIGLANAPVTVDLNGRVAVRARGAGDGPATELVLGRSAYTGVPVRFQTNREFLGRAVRLGFAEIEVVDPATPIVCRSGGWAYAWQPLDAESAIGPADDVVRIQSDPHPATPGKPPENEIDVKSTESSDGSDAGSPVEPRVRVAPEVPAPAGLAALIAEAEALHGAIGEARSRTGRLVAALRKQRRRDRLVQSTLASLRQLKLQGAAD